MPQSLAEHRRRGQYDHPSSIRAREQAEAEARGEGAEEREMLGRHQAELAKLGAQHRHAALALAQQHGGHRKIGKLGESAEMVLQREARAAADQQGRHRAERENLLSQHGRELAAHAARNPRA